MTTTDMTAAEASETMRNGVDTATLFATLDAVKGNNDIAKFQFRATNRWLGGAHNRSTIKNFYAAGGEDTSRDAHAALPSRNSTALEWMAARARARADSEGSMPMTSCSGPTRSRISLVTAPGPHPRSTIR